MIQLRLASSDETRCAESYSAFVARVNALCLGTFCRDIEKEVGAVAQRRNKRIEPEEFYNIFLQKVGGWSFTGSLTTLSVVLPSS